MTPRHVEHHFNTKLSDVLPNSASTIVSSPGTEGDVSRRDHHHHVQAANTAQEGVVELATDAESLTGTDATRAVTPAALTHVLDNTPHGVPNASTTVRGIIEVATVAEASAGTDTTRAVTPAGLAAAGGADGTVLNGNGAPAGNSGENGDTYRDDETGAWYKKASGAWSAALYTPPREIVDLTGTPLHIATEDDEGKVYVDHDLPAAWIAYRRRESDVEAFGTFGNFSHSQYHGEWATDDLAFYNGNASADNDGFWNTTDNVFRYLRPLPQPARFTDVSLPHWLTDILNETGTWVWLGYSDDQQDLLDKVDSFDSTFVYVGVVAGNMVQLDNDSFVVEVNGHDVWGWYDLVAGSEEFSAPKNVSVAYNIGAGHDVNDTSFNPWEGNIYRVERDGLIDGFSMWADPQVVVEYDGFMQRLARYGYEDYRPIRPLLEADNSITTTGAGTVELSYEYGTPFEVKAGDYLWVGVNVGATGAARGRQQADRYRH